MRHAYLYMIPVLVGWSIGPVGAKALLGRQITPVSPHPLLVAFWAISAGWVLLLAVLLLRGRLRRLADISGRGWLVLLAMGFFGWAGYAGSLNYAFVNLPLPDAVIINYLHPLFTVLFQGALFGRLVRALSRWEQAPVIPLTPAHPGRLAAGIGLCLLGVAFVATGGTGSFSPSPAEGQPVAGALAALFAAFSWGVYSNLGRFVSVKPGRADGSLGDVHTFAAMTFGLLMLAAALAPAGRLGSPAGYHTSLYFLRWGPAPVNAWVVVAAMGLFLYCGGFTLWLMALELGRAAGQAHKLPPLTYLTPILAMTNGWILLHEPFGPGFWQGALLIALGNLLIALPGSVGLARLRRAGGPPP